MKLLPQGDRLLVEVLEDKETATPNVKLQLILPEAKDTYGMPRKGKIVAVGNGEKCERMDFKEGDIVYFSKFVGQNMKISPRAFEDDKGYVPEEVQKKFDAGVVYLFLNTKDIYGRTYEEVSA